MAELRLLGETDRGMRRPARILDGVVHDYRTQIVQHLQSRAMPRHATLLAEANALPDVIQWFTALDGAIERLDDLAPDRRNAVLAQVRLLVEQVEGEAARLRADRSASLRGLGDLLATALEGATLADLRLVGGEPVLAGWGLRAVENAAALPNLKGELVRAQAVPVAVRPPAPPPAVPFGPASAVPFGSASAPGVPVMAPLQNWPTRLLGLAALLLLLAAVLAWFLPDLVSQAVARFRLPAPPICEEPAAADAGVLPLQEEEIRLRARIAELERSYAGRIQQCRIAAIPRPPALPPRSTVPPQPQPQQRSEIDQRLDRERAKSGETQVSLVWDSDADLDLHVTCPGGARIYFERRQGCGAVLDVDMNQTHIARRSRYGCVEENPAFAATSRGDGTRFCPLRRARSARIANT